MAYEIIIRNESDTEQPIKAVTGKNESIGGSMGGSATESLSKGQKYAMKLAKRVVGVGVIVHTADQVISHQLSTISLTTGAQEAGQRANYAYQKTSSFIQSVVMGAASGSVFGPVGALAGAGVAALLNLGNQAMDYFMRKDVINKERDLENVSRRMQMTRATVSGRRYSNVTEF